MPIRSISDVLAAHDAGRVHTQRFFKNAGTTGDGQWHDWAFASGQPGYDARIGVAGQFNPFIATKNDAIYFPDIPAGQHRHLSELTLRTLAGGTNQVSLGGILYDLLGVYPLIDGDNTERQEFTNVLTLPRYATGEFIFAVIVNHVAPVLANADGTLNYTNSDGVSKTISFTLFAAGQNKVCSALSGSNAACSIALPVASGDKGVRSIQSLQFATAPGGLFSIYLVRSLTTIANHDGRAVAEKVFTEKQFCQLNAWHMPRIYDGAHLGFFICPNGGARSFSMFGTATFIWG